MGFLASPWCIVHLGCTSFASHPPCVYKAWGSKMCLLLDMPCGRSSVGASSFVTPGSLLGSIKNCPHVFDRVCVFCIFKLYIQALVGRPSLHSYDACMIYWVQGASRRNCRQKQGRTSFSPNRVFLFSRNSRVRFGV